MADFDLKDHEISVADIRRNLPPATLYEEAIQFDKQTRIAASGSLVAYSGSKTGRSPKDKRVVRRSESEADIWWGSVNIALEPTAFDINR